MARIRDIKPEFFLDEDLAKLSETARLCFIGLWIYADREGRLDDRPERLRAQIFPYRHDVKMNEVLDELANSRGEFLIRYRVGGRGYLQIRSFGKHQRPHPKEQPSVIPPPPPAEAAQPGPVEPEPRPETASREISRQAADGFPSSASHENPAGTCRPGSSGISGSSGTGSSGSLGLGSGSGEARARDPMPGGTEPDPEPPDDEDVDDLPTDDDLFALEREAAKYWAEDTARAAKEHRERQAAATGPPPDPPARALAPLTVSTEVTAQRLLDTFGRLRAEIIPGALDWQAAGDRLWQKASKLAETFALHPEAIPDIEPTMRLLLEQAAESQDERDRETSFAFGAWVARFTDLREQIRGRRRQVRAGPKGAERDRRNVEAGLSWAAKKTGGAECEPTTAMRFR